MYFNSRIFFSVSLGRALIICNMCLQTEYLSWAKLFKWFTICSISRFVCREKISCYCREGISCYHLG